MSISRQKLLKTTNLEINQTWDKGCWILWGKKSELDAIFTLSVTHMTKLLNKQYLQLKTIS